MKTVIRRVKGQRIVEGEVLTCAHRISWWYRLPKGMRLVEEAATKLLEELQKAAEERAKEQIIEDYVCGELCCCYYLGTKEFELFGWWDIMK